MIDSLLKALTIIELRELASDEIANALEELKLESDEAMDLAFCAHQAAGALSIALGACLELEERYIEEAL